VTPASSSGYHEAVQSPASAKLQFTAAICTRNRVKELARTLDALEEQHANAPWEILVVDNASTDDTRRMLEQRAGRSRVPFQIASESRRGIAFGRNRALEAARGDAIVFVDDDAVPRHGWLQAHVSAFNDSKVVGTGGRILPVLPKSTPYWYERIVSDGNGGPTSRFDFGEQPGDITEGDGQMFPFAANMGMRRDTALEAGGFRTDLGWGVEWLPGEETELMRRLWRRGGRVRYVPDAVVDHYILESRATWDYYQHWQLGLGRATVRMNPPPSRLSWCNQVATNSWKILTWQSRASRRSLYGLPHRVYQARLKVRLYQGMLGELVVGGGTASEADPTSSDS